MYLKSVIALLLFGNLIVPLPAQFNSASLNGVIKDASGSVVPDARVTDEHRDWPDKNRQRGWRWCFPLSGAARGIL